MINTLFINLTIYNMEKYYGILALVFAIATVLAAASTSYPSAPLAGSIITAGFAIASKINTK
jgi:hypothetical protein